MGPLIYWIVGTSKDITIGPVAVMSTVTGTVVGNAANSLPDVPGNQIAGALAVLGGAFVFVLGITRLGFIVDFISLTAITAFITGAALNIGIGQIPGLLGISSKVVTIAVLHTMSLSAY